MTWFISRSTAFRTASTPRTCNDTVLNQYWNISWSKTALTPRSLNQWESRHSSGLSALYLHFFEYFSEAEALSIIRAWKWLLCTTMPDSIKSLKKSKQKLKSKNQLEAARKDLRRQEERVRKKVAQLTAALVAWTWNPRKVWNSWEMNTMIYKTPTSKRKQNWHESDPNWLNFALNLKK